MNKTSEKLHLGGSHGPTVLAAVMAALDAVREAESKLRACDPNGRDFVGRPDCFSDAQEEHRRGLGDLASLRARLEGRAEDLQDQIQGVAFE